MQRGLALPAAPAAAGGGVALPAAITSLAIAILAAILITLLGSLGTITRIAANRTTGLALVLASPTSLNRTARPLGVIRFVISCLAECCATVLSV